ncbi:hypothetical protein ONA91_26030 [Micromonospora sp. DR5-3]|uniref:hypothetical protein n=1 Tax=unclassified Micromonospora TaxID=2617518 RepID=UPI002106D80B|nr:MULTISPECIES: hypothetical protein [unclassified Micromonospora]MCW3817913.1 hypothetical protein [Micromonospora sp. DR5-3]
MPAATATQQTKPAEAVWLPSDGIQRVRLVDLPTDHGRAVADNPNFIDGIFTT